MALSDDQKAMLRLLAQREQGYDDLASLMGLSVDEIRVRVKEALEEIDKGESAPPLSPAPDRPEPEKAETAAPPEPPPSKPMAKRPRPRISLPANPRLRISLAAAGGLALVLLVLLVAGIFGGEDGGGDPSPSTAGGGEANGQADAPAGSDQLTQAMLTPTDGGDASGQALFGRIRDTAVLQVEAEGLEPSPPGQLYTVWLYGSPRVALRVGAIRVTDGGISAQFPLPTEVLGYVAGGGFNQIDVSLTSNAAYRAEVAAARRAQRLPAYTGTSVLRGEIAGRLVEAGARSRAGG